MARTTSIVTSFVMDRSHGGTSGDGRLLILKRSGRVKTMKGMWAGVSGIIEGREDPLSRAKIEIFEEAGLAERAITLVRAADRMRVDSPQYPDHEWLVFPFLFETADTRIMLNWENSEFRWIRAADLGRYRTVPDLERVLLSLLPPSSSSLPPQTSPRP